MAVKSVVEEGVETVGISTKLATVFIQSHGQNFSKGK